MMVQQVHKWYREFREGCQEVHDELWLGRPCVWTEDTLNTIRAIVEDDRRE